MDMKINLLYFFSCNGYWEMKQKKKKKNLKNNVVQGHTN